MFPRVLVSGFLNLALAAGQSEIPAGATELRQVTSPAVSSDGKSMVFEWINDLWTASTEGGEAIRVVENPARDAYPLFTPDGKRIVFSSDRTGSLLVFSIPVGGGEVVQHTHQTQGNELECLSPDGTHAIVRGPRERSGFRATDLFIIDLTKDAREQRLFNAPADEASWSPDGKRVLFSTGGEQLYRKGYQGSRASRIWQYDIPSGTFECKVAEEAEARTPVWQADGKGFFYLSSRTGALNLWSQRDDTQGPVAITREVGDGVYSRVPAADGSLFVFHRGFDLFALRPGSAPQRLKLWTRAQLPDVSRVRESITGVADADFTAGLDQVIFSAAGELWWKRSQKDEAKRLTNTAMAEKDVRFSPDGCWLYFLRDDGLNPNYLRATFVDGEILSEQQITRNSRSKGSFKPSPDGTRIAWVEGTGDVICARADGSDPHLVFKCWDRPAFDWSPNSRWLAIAARDQNSNRDIWLGDAEGRRAPINLTRIPASENSPCWSPDGRWLVFSARRGGGSLQLWRIDFGRDGPQSDEEVALAADNAKLLATDGIEPIRIIWAADSKSLFFQNQKTSDRKLYSVTLADGEVKSLAGERGIPIRVTSDNSLLWLVNQTPAIFKGTTSLLFPVSISSDRPRGEVMTLAFRRIWKTLGERFYDPTMNGTDWEALRLKYEPAAARCRTSRQFDRTISQLCGQLNASHLSFLRQPWQEEVVKTRKEEPTAHPGLVFKDALAGGRLEIARVIKGSPVAQVGNAPEPGEWVVRIAGEEVTNHTPLHRFFNGAENRPLPVVIRSKAGKERVVEIRCISYSRVRSLESQECQRLAREKVLKSGEYSYLKVSDMSMKSFTKLEQSIYRESLQSKGLILDFRGNGGGREADRMLALFCQPAHSFTLPRDGPKGYPNDRLVHASWNQPLVVLCNENTFSNAEIFCHAMKEVRRAPLVGTTTAGGVISAVKVTIPDAGVLQVPFRGWFQTTTGKNLDRNGAVPDFPVDLTPADENQSYDPQFEKAVEVLIKSVRGD